MNMPSCQNQTTKSPFRVDDQNKDWSSLDLRYRPEDRLCRLSLSCQNLKQSQAHYGNNTVLSVNRKAESLC